jgi:hypothetical protein
MSGTKWSLHRGQQTSLAGSGSGAADFGAGGGDAARDGFNSMPAPHD